MFSTGLYLMVMLSYKNNLHISLEGNLSSDFIVIFSTKRECLRSFALNKNL